MKDPHASTDQRALLERAYVRLKELQAELDSHRRARTEPLAVVGLGCRFPGGVGGADSYWQLLSDGRDAVTRAPAERGLDCGEGGAGASPLGGYLSRVDEFDPAFFGVTPLEAEAMDPQQRLLLEVAWEALEDAGQTLESLRRATAGVFVGAYNNDYFLLQLDGSFNTYTSSGNALSILANRLSYFFDLRGPSLTVDTACSSSLVAVHLACRSLRNRECDVALAGGVNLILSPVSTEVTSKVLPMARDGRCKSFDASADGIVRGEGCGLLVLKRLSDALAGGDRVLALVRGSAMNQDGRSNGLTAPNGLSQQAVIRRALEDAGLEPARVGLIEAHGTGTTLGDPIEMEALQEVYGGAAAANGGPRAVGSVKANLGHLEAAAGVAGLIKVVLALRQRSVPKQPNFKELNPNIALDGGSFFIPAETSEWPDGDEPRCAAVSSFGFGGTNAHVICEEFVAASPRTNAAARPTAGPLVLPLSAHDEHALRASAEAHRELLRGGDARGGPSAEEVCYTASVRRSHLNHRLAVVGESRESLAAGLEDYLAGEAPERVAAGVGDERRGRPVAFVFSGQGPQWWGMGRELMEAEPAFAESMRRTDGLFREHAGHSILGFLDSDEERSPLWRTSAAQPALFAMQVALAELWRARGVRPGAVVGHSLGEVAAACVCGALTLAEGVRVVAGRVRLMEGELARGKMVEVNIAGDEAEHLLSSAGGAVSVAAFNGTTATVLSGYTAAVEEVLRSLAERRVSYRYVSSDYAFHSRQMEAAGRDLAGALRDLAPRAAEPPFYSTVTGRQHGGEQLDASYWARNISQPVLFKQAVGALIADGYRDFLEIGPHPALAAYVSQQLDELQARGRVFASLRRRRELHTMRQTLASLYALGFDVRWESCYAAPLPHAPLPPYPFQRKRYWSGTTRAAHRAQANGDGGKAALHDAGAAQAHDAPRTERKNGARSSSPTRAARGRAEWAAADPSERPELLQSWLRRHALRVLGRDDAEPLDPRQPLGELGFDSLMAVELKGRIERDLDVVIPMKALFEGPSIVKLAADLCAQLNAAEAALAAKPNGNGGNGARPRPQPDASASQILERLDSLTDDEVERMLKTFIPHGVADE